MANYTTADIKEVRAKTGAGMLDVKKALDEAGGDKVKARGWSIASAYGRVRAGLAWVRQRRFALVAGRNVN